MSHAISRDPKDKEVDEYANAHGEVFAYVSDKALLSVLKDFEKMYTCNDEGEMVSKEGHVYTDDDEQKEKYVKAFLHVVVKKVNALLPGKKEEALDLLQTIEQYLIPEFEYMDGDLKEYCHFVFRIGKKKHIILTDVIFEMLSEDKLPFSLALRALLALGQHQRAKAVRLIGKVSTATRERTPVLKAVAKVIESMESSNSNNNNNNNSNSNSVKSKPKGGRRTRTRKAQKKNNRQTRRLN